MAISNLFSFNLRSFVHTTKADATAKFATKGDKKISLTELIEDNIPELHNNTWFWNSPALPNGQLQTIYAAIGDQEHVDQIYYGRRLITWEDDGSTVSVDYVIDPPSSKAEWDESAKYSPISDPPPSPVRTRYLRPEEEVKLHTSANEDKPLVILLHGLTGGSHESYVRASITPLISEKYGFDCAVLNSRGCARTKITTPQLFCALLTDDIRRYVNLIKREQPNRRIYLVGYSLGACIMANYLGQEGDASKVEAAIAVAAPWDLNLCFVALHSDWIGRSVYSAQMCSNLKRLIKNHRHMLSKDVRFHEAQEKDIKYVVDFDNAYTAPFFGFNTAQDYYRKASPVNRLLAIRTPMLVLSSKDDPVAGSAALPYQEVLANPYTFMAVTDVGGHLGWFQPGGKRWFPEVIAKFFKSFNDQVDHTKPVEVAIKRQENKFINDRLVLN